MRKSKAFRSSFSYAFILSEIVRMGSFSAFSKKYEDYITEFGQTLLRGVKDQVRDTDPDFYDVIKDYKFLKFLGAGSLGVVTLVESPSKVLYTFKHILPSIDIAKIDKDEKGIVNKIKNFNWTMASKKKHAVASHKLNRIRRSLIVQSKFRHHLQMKGLSMFLRIPDFLHLVEVPKFTVIQEYIDGKNIYEYARDECKSVEERIELIYGIVKGVEVCLHEWQIVHSDLKPDNILVTSDREICLIDWDFVKNFNKPENFTVPGERVRNVFAHPECILDLGKRSYIHDVYMLGRIMWCCCIPRYPKTEEDFYEILIPHEGLQKIYEKTENDGYKNIKEFRTDLEKLLPKESCKVDLAALECLDVPSKYQKQVQLFINLLERIKSCYLEKLK